MQTSMMEGSPKGEKTGGQPFDDQTMIQKEVIRPRRATINGVEKIPSRTLICIRTKQEQMPPLGTLTSVSRLYGVSYSPTVLRTPHLPARSKTSNLRSPPSVVVQLQLIPDDLTEVRVPSVDRSLSPPSYSVRKRGPFAYSRCFVQDKGPPPSPPPPPPFYRVMSPRSGRQNR